MVDEMLVAQAQWLPQYKKAVAEAKKRLARGKPIKTNVNYKGAARLKVKTVAEMSKDAKKARESAAAADKAAADRAAAVKKTKKTGGR
jgi:alpha-galactosidase